MKELRKRWRSNTPPLFKKIIKIGITAGTAGLAIISSPIALPLYITALAPHLITSGIIATLISKITVDDTDKEPELELPTKEIEPNI